MSNTLSFGLTYVAVAGFVCGEIFWLVFVVEEFFFNDTVLCFGSGSGRMLGSKLSFYLVVYWGNI